VTELILIVGGLALLAGALSAWPFLRRRAGPASPGPPASAAELTGLREELEARYQAIAELDADLAGGKLSSEDHGRLRTELETGAALLLGRTEMLEPTLAEAKRPRVQTPQRPPVETGWLQLLGRPPTLVAGALGLLVVGLGLGLLLARLTSPAPPSARSPSSDRLAQLEQELRENPSDLKRLLAFAHRALDEDRLSEAIAAYKQIVERDPNNVEAITHTGLILFASGNVDQALAHLDKALTLDPTYAHALWDKANILYRAKQDYTGAIKALEAFLTVIPSGQDADQARAMIAEAKGRALAPKPTGLQPSKPGGGK